ncbi:hypothetical protein [Streptomyces sp.]|uniref:hypothetical protein n=1 Tax=Streptomyces sp. TaxID=1931 RepID=UPI002F941F2D
MPWRGADPGEPFPYPSLGWNLLEWWAEFLPSPRDHAEPLIFTDEQARILVEWYALDPNTGRYLYRRGVSRRSKGWGKSPVEAVKAIAALAGEVVFDGWDASGEPVGRPRGLRGGDPNPWVQIAAVSEDQTKNTYSVLHELLTANDARAADELRIDVGLTRCFLRDRPGKLEPVTAEAGSREGQPITDAVLDETHLWTSRNGGIKLARTLRRNVAKMNGRTFETTNSFAPGEMSVAEATHKAIERGAPGIYCDAVEAPEVKQDDSDAALHAALAVAYGDSWWVDLERLVADIRDPDQPWEDSQRFFFNWNVDDRKKAVQSKRWTALKRDPAPELPAGTRIGLGFDGSISQDCTALIGCAMVDDVPYVFEIEVWSRPEGAGRDWRIPRKEVQARVAETFEFYDVGLMFCDPPKWQTEIEGWAEEFGEERVVFFDTNQPQRMAPACGRMLTALEEEGAFSHDGAADLTEQVLAMHKRKVRIRDDDDDGRTKYVFVKGPDAEKIDAGIGAVLALEAFAAMPAVEQDQPFFGAWR